MAEITETNAPLEQDQLQVDAKAELAQAMQIALNNGIVPQDQVIAGAVTDTSTTIEPITQTDTATDVPTPNSFDVVRDRFEYKTPEDAIKEIEEYRKFKENPVTEIEFENEASKKLFEAIKGGKQKEAYAILAEQETLSNFTAAEVTKDNAADIIKLGMKYKYKDLTPSEIDYKYKKSFSLPKEPIQGKEDDDDEFAELHNDWENQVADIEMEKVMEAKLIKPELESRITKLVLPEIETEVDQDFVQWKQAQEQAPKLQAETEQAYKQFTPKSIETKIAFNDEANKVQFEYQYEPTVESLAKSVEMVTDINKFYNLFINQDGTPNRKEFLEAIHFAVNRKEILTEALKQSKNATIKAVALPDNSGGAMVRHLPQQQTVSELDAMMQQRGIAR